MLWGNEHMISVWPVRSSLLVDGSDVFWAAGFFPKEGIYICKRNAADGSGGWTARGKMPPQGYLLATSDRLFVPSGRSYPAILNRANGKSLGYVKKVGGWSKYDGGSWALVTPDQADLWARTIDGKTGQFKQTLAIGLSYRLL